MSADLEALKVEAIASTKAEHDARSAYVDRQVEAKKAVVRYLRAAAPVAVGDTVRRGKDGSEWLVAEISVRWYDELIDNPPQVPSPTYAVRKIRKDGTPGAISNGYWLNFEKFRVVARRLDPGPERGGDGDELQEEIDQQLGDMLAEEIAKHVAGGFEEIKAGDGGEG